MKKRNFLITTLLVVAATTIAVVSCKKETQANLLGNSPQPEKTFTPPEVDDMNAYLKDFKLKMQNATRDNEETLSLEEAAWHLSSVANYDFANVNVQFTDLRYDTLYYNINVSNGQVVLSDLNSVYSSMSSDIDAFYQNLILENKHFHFIQTSISENGVVTVSLTTTFGGGSRYLSDTAWYFNDQWEAEMVCYDYFNEDSCYKPFGYGKSELERILDIYESRPINPGSTRVYYIYTRSKEFYYDDYIDPFGSPFYNNSRLYATRSYYTCMTFDEFCYCIDSYLGLGIEYCLLDEKTIQWHLAFLDGELESQAVGNHYLTVDYGIPISTDNNNNY